MWCYDLIHRFNLRGHLSDETHVWSSKPQYTESFKGQWLKDLLKIVRPFDDSDQNKSKKNWMNHLEKNFFNLFIPHNCCLIYLQRLEE